MRFDKLISGGMLVTPEGRYPGTIGIKDGKIACISRCNEGMEADEVIDATGKFVLPGAIDGHVHYQEPINPAAEDVEHATRACAAGGITTGICMCNDWLMSVDGYHKMQEVFRGKGYVDYGFHAWAKPVNLDALEDLWTKTEICGMKTYTTYDDRVSDGDLWQIFETGARCGGLTMIHAENDSLIKMFVERLRAEGRKDPMAHVDSRPAVVEIETIRRCIFLAEQTNAQIIIVHVSTAEGLMEIKKARQRGVKVWAESCPQYLTFVPEEIEEYGAFLAFAPVMRSEENRRKMWELLDKGYIQTIGSDHCPCEKETKLKSNEDMLNAFCGLSGLEAFMPVLLNGVNDGLVSLERVVQVTSANPARMYGLYPQKGLLQAGADADLNIVDMDMEKALADADLKVKCGWSPYVGRKLKGWPVLTMVRGEVVARDGEIVGRKGHGQQAMRLAPFDLKAE